MSIENPACVIHGRDFSAIDRRLSDRAPGMIRPLCAMGCTAMVLVTKVSGEKRFLTPFLQGVMMINIENRNIDPWVKGLIIAGLVALFCGPPALEASQFSPPDLEGFNLHAERDGDGDGDGVKETHIRQYFNDTGDSVVSMTTKGRLWAWNLDVRNNDSATRNYVIRDSDCDGVFDEVYGLDDEFHVPDCLK